MCGNNLKNIFRSTFSESADPLIVSSPGRINLIGEHTDYNNGFVLPAAIDKAALFAVSLREDDEIHLYAHDLDEKFSIRINELKPIEDINWPNYMLGVVAQFVKKGTTVSGFNAVLTSNIPMGAGLSSSAAVSCATAFALNELYKTRFDKITLVKMAQIAEHEYAGVKCGIMDQFASMFGEANKVIRLDCRSLTYEYFPLDMEGLSIVLLDTQVKHALASSEYNLRREQCDNGVALIQNKYPEVESLRDADMNMLVECVPGEDIIYHRCKYVIEEKQRLLDACAALEKKDTATFGEKMFATHDGLSKEYEVSCKELDWLVDQVRGNDDVIGARMMGGGFGGCTINLVKEAAVENLIEKITPAYKVALGLDLRAYIVSLRNGTSIID
ncbi:MAG: galactokinase [Chitinophagaceae bacterium]|nr:galactokinase [Chitinophagaceae bacterium]